MSEGFINDPDYNDILNLIMDIEIIPGSPKDNFIEELENLYFLKS